MQIYLPIAEMSVNILEIIVVGGFVGILGGIFGVGGGFLSTPLLIFLGIPPAVAVGTQSSNVVASSTSGMLAHWRRKKVDFKMGNLMVLGGTMGSAVGVSVFHFLQREGYVDVVIAVGYVILLGAIGGFTFFETVRTHHRKKKATKRRKLHKHHFLHGMPFKMRFPASRLYISALLPIGLGVIGGLMISIMGVAGGFLLVPAMIYVLGMGTRLVAGTSLYQIIFTAALTTMLHSATTHTIDLVLAMFLILGSVVGAQYGSRLSDKLGGEQMKILLALILLAVAGKMAADLVMMPDEIFVVDVMNENTI